MTVFEVFSRAVPKVSGPALCTIFEAIGAVQDVIVSRLLVKRSELLVSDYDATLTYAAGKKEKMLPEEFLGFVDRPYLADATRLNPLRGQGLAGTETGEPQFYKTKGHLLTIYPTPTEETVVYAPFYARPETPTEMDDELPFWGMFDSAFVDAVVPVLSLGVTAAGEAGFRATIESQVDLVLQAKDMSDEQLLADSINDVDQD